MLLHFIFWSGTNWRSTCYHNFIILLKAYCNDLRVLKRWTWFIICRMVNFHYFLHTWNVGFCVFVYFKILILNLLCRDSEMSSLSSKNDLPGMLPRAFVTTALGKGRGLLICFLNLFPRTNQLSLHGDPPICPHRVEAPSSLHSLLLNTFLLTPACLEILGITAWQCATLDKHLVMDT